MARFVISHYGNILDTLSPRPQLTGAFEGRQSVSNNAQMILQVIVHVFRLSDISCVITSTTSTFQCTKFEMRTRTLFCLAMLQK
jgi:hypothetical protein